MLSRIHSNSVLSKLKYKSYFSTQSQSNFVRIVEVGPRDGLQNEKTQVATNAKIEFINRLSQTGLRTVETTSFVSPKWIPQFSDNVEVLQGITKFKDVSYPVLVPNLVGFKNAVAAGAKEISIFIAASDSFSKKNINCTVDESVNKCKPVIEAASELKIPVRGYLSTVIGCPYEGRIAPKIVTQLAEKLLELGCYEISLGDTIGVGTPGTVSKLLDDVTKSVPSKQLAVHFHDTYGQALSNVLKSLEYGILTVDASVSGLGGCPYAAGASGNVATEDVVYMLHGLGLNTGISLEKLISAGKYICDHISKKSESKVALAFRKGNKFIEEPL